MTGLVAALKPRCARFAPNKRILMAPRPPNYSQERANRERKQRAKAEERAERNAQKSAARKAAREGGTAESSGTDTGPKDTQQD